MTFPMRINKYLADQKIASRREADTLIERKQVLINGKPAVLGQMVALGDKVEVAGETKRYVYLAYYKGRGVITHSPQGAEVDIATRLKQDYNLRDLAPVGRLDKDSEGLIIITNDGHHVTGNAFQFVIAIDMFIRQPILQYTHAKRTFLLQVVALVIAEYDVCHQLFGCAGVAKPLGLQFLQFTRWH